VAVSQIADSVIPVEKVRAEAAKPWIIARKPGLGLLGWGL